jgi:sigma-B regulation protein RsbQ
MSDSKRQAALVKHAAVVSGPSDAARTLVFTHGFGSDQSVWAPVVTDLARDHRVVTYDLAGCGRSDPAAFVQYRYLNLQGFALDLVDLIEALGLRDVVAIGHSMGAMASALARIARPDLIARLVLIGASPHYLDQPGYRGGFSPQDVDDVYGAITRDFQGWSETFARRCMGHPEHPDLAAEFVRSFQAMPPANVLTMACAIFQSDHREDMAKVSCPTLILQAGHDAAVPPEVAQFLHDAIRDSRLVHLDATGHLPHASAPGEVVAAIREFLAEA